MHLLLKYHQRSKRKYNRQLLEQEKQNRKFSIRFIESPKPQSFCDLWKPINKLLANTDPDCYFLLNISDEMLFATKGWDTILSTYVGKFPDGIFRLRASRNKLRNYFDRWECSFAQDSIPITTKKWVVIGGDWNPCFGPDSFQQLVAFYLAKEGIFSNENYLREIPLLDIEFTGDVPALGIQEEKRWKHISDHIKAMQICQSYRMQLEARRRAILLKAHIIAYKHQIDHFETKDNKRKKQILLINKSNGAIVAQLSYRLSWLSITLTNQYRKIYFFNYFGDGKYSQINPLISFAKYLYLKYLFFYRFIKCIKTSQAGIKSLLRELLLDKPATNLKEENKRLKELYASSCLEVEKLQNQLNHKSTIENLFQPTKLE